MSSSAVSTAPTSASRSSGMTKLTSPPFDIHTNPYRTRKQWPPDFTRLSPKHQFRMERKYKRRSVLKYARPGWMKGVKLAQWATMTGAVVYAVFFMEGGTGSSGPPFQTIRKWVGRQAESFERGRPEKKPENTGS